MTAPENFPDGQGLDAGCLAILIAERLAALNPKASVKLANRLLEASDRGYWKPDQDVLAALEGAGDELEDRLEGLRPSTPASTPPAKESPMSRVA